MLMLRAAAPYWGLHWMTFSHDLLNVSNGPYHHLDGWHQLEKLAGRNLRQTEAV